jgi:hypothetical protein
MKTLITLLMWMVVASPVCGEFYSGNELLSECQEEVGSIGRGVCAGYIASATDMVLAFQLSGLATEVICVPSSVTLRQLVKVITKYSNENPGELHAPASSQIYIALLETFPCE